MSFIEREVYLYDNIPSVTDALAEIEQYMEEMLLIVVDRSQLNNNNNEADDDDLDETSDEIYSNIQDNSLFESLGLPMSFTGRHLFTTSDDEKQPTKKRKVLLTKNKIKLSNKPISNKKRRKLRYKHSLHTKLHDQPPPTNINIHHKYWDQRYRLLSKYDHGIILDEESWYSITPEVIANHITNTIINSANMYNKRLNILFDGFSGCGGNAISAASSSAFQHVLAIDFDPIKSSYCQHNSYIYGVYDKITCITKDIYQVFDDIIALKTAVNTTTNTTNTADDTITDENNSSDSTTSSLSLLQQYRHSLSDTLSPPQINTLQTPPSAAAAAVPDKCVTPSPIDVMILSPPWGGPEYNKHTNFNLRTHLTSGTKLLCIPYYVLFYTVISFKYLSSNILHTPHCTVALCLMYTTTP